MDAAEFAIASHFLGRTWSAILPVFRLVQEEQRVAHFSKAFTTEDVDAMPLPLANKRSARQTIALAERTRFYRQTNDKAIAAAYKERPRTRIYESMEVRSEGWYSFVALQLTRLARCRVVCTMYESNSGDRNLGVHSDQWLGAIVQMRGAKNWKFWPRTSTEPQEVLAQTGDMILLPKGVEHTASTPDYSVHLVFAFVTGETIQ